MTSAKPTRAELMKRVSVDPGTGCWAWQMHIDPDGYGRWLRNRAHRVAYELLVGPIPEGLYLDHLCRNRACVNPAHLEPVPHRVNVLRGVSPAAKHAAKTHCPKGHPYDEANTRYRKDGSRTCRACDAESHRERYHQMKAEVSS